jgi:hypothetical protein
MWNKWTRIPHEVRESIFHNADPLTQYLNNHGDYRNHDLVKDSEYLSRMVWISAFEQDWDGDLLLLPQKHLPDTNWDDPEALQESKELYFNEQCDPSSKSTKRRSAPSLGYVPCRPPQKTPNQRIATTIQSKAMYDRLKTIPNISGKLLLNIAMHHMWLSEIPSHLPPQKLIVYALEGIHHKFFLHLHSLGYVSESHWKRFFNKACGQGDLNFIKHLHSTPPFSTYGCTDQALHNAASNGHLSVVEFLHHNRTEGCTTSTLNVTASHGYLDIVKFLSTNRLGGGSSRGVNDAAGKGYLDIVKYLHVNRSHDMKPTSEAMDAACMDGHLEVVKYLMGVVKASCSSYAMDSAASNGFLEIVKCLHSKKKVECTEAAMDGAAGNGHLDVVEFLHTNRKEGCTMEAMDGACANGHLEVVEYLHKNRREGCTQRALDEAAFNGFLEVVRYLLENNVRGIRVTNEAINNAAERGHLEIIKYLYDCHKTKAAPTIPNSATREAAKNKKKLKILPEITYNIAKRGDLTTLQLLYSLELISTNTNTNTKSTLFQAATDAFAQNGHLQQLQALHSLNMLQPTPETFTLAADRNHLDILKFLHSTHPNITPSPSIFETPSKKGHLNILQFIHSAYPSLTPKPSALDNAASRGHLNILQFIHSAYPSLTPKPSALDNAASQGHLAILQHFSTHYPTIIPTHNAIDQAACNNHLSTLRFLHSTYPHHPSLRPSKKAMRNAAANGHLQMIQYLHSTYNNNNNNNNTTLGYEVLNVAAGNGHLSIVEYLHKTLSAPCDPRILVWCAEGEEMLILKYFIENKVREWTGEDVEAALVASVGCRNLEMVRYLHVHLKSMPASSSYITTTDDNDDDDDHDDNSDEINNNNINITGSCNGLLILAAAKEASIDILMDLVNHPDHLPSCVSCRSKVLESFKYVIRSRIPELLHLYYVNFASQLSVLRVGVPEDAEEGFDISEFWIEDDVEDDFEDDDDDFVGDHDDEDEDVRYADEVWDLLEERMREVVGIDVDAESDEEDDD